MLLHFRRNILVLRRRAAGTLLLDKPIATPQRSIAIQHMFVFPDMQKQGVGSQLLADAECVTQTLFPSVEIISATVPLDIGVFFGKNGYELDALIGDNLLATKLLKKPPSHPQDNGRSTSINISCPTAREVEYFGENTKRMEEDPRSDAHGTVQCLDRVCTEEPRTLAKRCGAGAT